MIWDCKPSMVVSLRVLYTVRFMLPSKVEAAPRGALNNNAAGESMPSAAAIMKSLAAPSWGCSQTRDILVTSRGGTRGHRHESGHDHKVQQAVCRSRA